jgi:hypothetical protein
MPNLQQSSQQSSVNDSSYITETDSASPDGNPADNSVHAL